MTAPPATVNLFHITALANLPGIVANGGLFAKNRHAAAGVQHANIAYQDVQTRRAAKQVTCGPGGVVHDYVPFYFAPRSPMLMTINSGNVPGCDLRQDDIVHLRTRVATVVDAGLDFVFFNYNAATMIAQAFDDLARLDQIDWELFFEAPQLDGYCKYWNSNLSRPRYVRRMETRQAEFLVHGTVPLAVIEEVVARTNPIAAQVEQVLRQAGYATPVRAQPAWYY